MRNIKLIAFCFLLLIPSVINCQDKTKKFIPVEGQEGKNVPWIPTPQILVDKMLQMARITPSDFLIDLGSGDGRTVITAAKQGTKSLGIEYNPDFVTLARENAKKAGVTSMTQFIKADIFEYDFSKASVITMFLLPEINMKLRPRLFNLKPGTRIVSNTFAMQDWKADETAKTEKADDRWNMAYLWIVPAKIEGKWKLQDGGELIINQKFQVFTGSLKNENKITPIVAGKLRGNEISFTAGSISYKGQVKGSKLVGTFISGGKEGKWSAIRNP
jgi:precorrin-6B methylase 2